MCDEGAMQSRRWRRRRKGRGTRPCAAAGAGGGSKLSVTGLAGGGSEGGGLSRIGATKVKTRLRPMPKRHAEAHRRRAVKRKEQSAGKDRRGGRVFERNEVERRLPLKRAKSICPE